MVRSYTASNPILSEINAYFRKGQMRIHCYGQSTGRRNRLQTRRNELEITIFDCDDL